MASKKKLNKIAKAGGGYNIFHENPHLTRKENKRELHFMRIQSFFEYWRKVACPSCKTINWIYDSHSERHYPNIPQGCECYVCQNKFWLGDEDSLKEEYWTEFEEEGIDYVLDEIINYDKGRPNPN